MTAYERRTTLALASILSMRMLGLFMILPVFALYAQKLPHTTPLLIGIAIGIYGLTQALLQIPFGMLSDKWGRKPMIIIGLLLFALGSVIAATATSITGIIIGRALQGCGAIAAVVLALTADLIREEHRLKTMALLGMTIGLSFVVALIIGPWLNQWLGVPGLFWLTAVFAGISLIVLLTLVPQPITLRIHKDSEPNIKQLKQLLKNPQLLRLDIGILLLHMILTALFVVLPLSLQTQLESSYHSYLYLVVLVLAIITIIPLIIIGEKYRHLKALFVGAVTLLGVSQLGLIYGHQSLMSIGVLLFLFFTAFNVLEASLPSLMSKLAPLESKGTAMGIYASAQFFGAFLGGVSGGWLHHYYGIEAVFSFAVGLSLIWLALAITMKNPPYLSSQLLSVGAIDTTRANQLIHCLTQVPGVAEVVIFIEEEVAYLKVDRRILDPSALDNCLIIERG